MSKKKKIAWFVVFVILLSAVYFLLWKNEAFAPHTILIQNSNDSVDDTADTPQTGGLSATDTATNSDTAPENTEPTKTIASPEINNNSSEKLPAPPTDKPATTSDSKIIQKLVSWGFSQASNRKIDTIIVHSSYNALGGDEYDVEKLIEEYKEYGVAPHYLIDREGKIYQLVADKNIAYHAGESKVPDGRSQVNNFSLGIEMINTKEDKYTSIQYASLNSLIAKIKSDYSIKYVLGHDDISPGRKTDPWNFDWKKIGK